MIAGSYGKSMFSLVRNRQTIFKVTVLFYVPTIPPAMYQSSCCSTSLSACGVVSALDFGHSNRCVVVSHCCFNLHFPDDMCYGLSFHMLICLW